MASNRPKRKGIASLVILPSIFLFAGFCILTSGIGDYRLYLPDDIPFVYQLNNSTPTEYLESIERGHLQWNDVPSSSFEFTMGANTSAQSPAFDGINLVFFDLAGVNFGPPPSNVIAFSQTWTSSAGGYHAVESDLIWNARDFPPSPTGQGGQQDLQSVIAHEFGHHLGLGHQGPFGGPPGCGETILQAVMYGFSSAGDTSNRHLHIHDIAGVSAIYPTWILLGNVTDASTMEVIEGAQIEYLGTNSLSVGVVSGSQRPGEVFTLDFSDASGDYGNVVLDQTFDVVIDAFGYLPDTTMISFDPPGGVGVTETLIHDVALAIAPDASFSGIVRDAGTSDPVSATVEFYGAYDPEGLTFSTTTNPDGSYSAMIPGEELYRIVVKPAAPYIDSLSAEDVLLPSSGLVMDWELTEAEVLLVDDDGGDTYETYYLESLNRLNISRRTYSVADSGTVPTAILGTFAQPPLLIWFTGDETTEAMTDEEGTSIIGHLDNNGYAIITGQNIAEYASPANTLITNYLGVQHTGNSTSILIRGFPGDIIGQNGFYLIGGAGNQSSRDHVTIVPGPNGTPTRTLYFGGGTDSSALAGVRVSGTTGWSATYFSTGLEGFTESARDSFIVRSMRLFGIVTGVDGNVPTGLPRVYRMEQNYPNPFNPSTEIHYALPEQSRVTLVVYNLLGQQVRQLVDDDVPAGHHTVTWNALNESGRAMASGVYFYRIEAVGASGPRFADVRKMLLLR